MDIAEAIELARHQHHCVLATRKRDGGPQLSAVTHGVDADGRLMISTREPAMKVHNIRRDPRVTAMVLADDFFSRWAQIDGNAEIVPLPEAMPLLDDVYRQVQGEHPDWDEFHQAMEQQRRVIIRITPTAAGPNRAG